MPGYDVTEWARMKTISSAKRHALLARANTEGWKQLTPYHFQKWVMDEEGYDACINWYPSTHKWVLNGHVVRNPKTFGTYIYLQLYPDGAKPYAER